MKKTPKAKAVPKAAKLPEFEPGKHYRIHFANGHSGEYAGDALVHCVPFDVSQIVSVEEMTPAS